MQRTALRAAADAERSVARAAGGWRRVVPTSSGVDRWQEGRGTCAGHRWPAGCRRAPWERGAVPQALGASPTEQRTGADRANGGFSPCGCRPWRGGSPRALGSARRVSCGRRALGVPGFPHRQWQGHVPSSPRRVRACIALPSAAAGGVGVACSAVSQARPPVPVRAGGDAPVQHTRRHGRAMRPARGRVHRVQAPSDRADRACGWCHPVREPSVSVTGWSWLVAVPPAATGARQHGAPETASAPTGHARASVVGRRAICRTAGRRRGGRWWPFRVRRRRTPRRVWLPCAGGAHAARLGGHGPRRRRASGEARHRPNRRTPAPGHRWGARGSPLQRSAPPPGVLLAWAGGRAVRVRGGVVQAGGLRTSRDGAGPEAGAQRGPTTHWSRPRQGQPVPEAHRSWRGGSPRAFGCVPSSLKAKGQ